MIFFVCVDNVHLHLIQCSALRGHCDAYCRPDDDTYWLKFDDSTVIGAELPVATPDAYVLFFRRVSGTPRKLQSLMESDERCQDGSTWIQELERLEAVSISEAKAKTALRIGNSIATTAVGFEVPSTSLALPSSPDVIGLGLHVDRVLNGFKVLQVSNSNIIPNLLNLCVHHVRQIIPGLGAHADGRIAVGDVIFVNLLNDFCFCG